MAKARFLLKSSGESAFVEIGEAVGGVVWQADHLLRLLRSFPLPQHHPDHQENDLESKQKRF
jgi:hypothetical protein